MAGTVEALTAKEQLVLRGRRNAASLICAVRAYDAVDVEKILLGLGREELFALAVTLAAAIDPEKRLGELLSWVEGDDIAEILRRAQESSGLRPCGTHAAFIRHKANDEKPCTACEDAEVDYQRARHRRRVAERNAA